MIYEKSGGGGAEGGMTPGRHMAPEPQPVNRAARRARARERRSGTQATTPARGDPRPRPPSSDHTPETGVSSDQTPVSSDHTPMGAS